MSQTLSTSGLTKAERTQHRSSSNRHHLSEKTPARLGRRGGLRNPLEHICSIAPGTQASEGEAAGVSLSHGERQTV